jgi:hypothetical protein
LGLNSGFGDSAGGGRGADLCVCILAGSFPMEALSMTEPVTAYDGGMLADLLRSMGGRRNGGGSAPFDDCAA